MNPSSPTDTVAIMSALIYATSNHSATESVNLAKLIYSEVQLKEIQNEQHAG